MQYLLDKLRLLVPLAILSSSDGCVSASEDDEGVWSEGSNSMFSPSCDRKLRRGSESCVESWGGGGGRMEGGGGRWRGRWEIEGGGGGRYREGDGGRGDGGRGGRYREGDGRRGDGGEVGDRGRAGKGDGGRGVLILLVI